MRFMPHKHCYLKSDTTLLINVIANGLIALAYFVIPLSLLNLIIAGSKINNTFLRTALMFGGFILACGVGHVISVIVVWFPVYNLQGIWGLITAALSIATAFYLSLKANPIINSFLRSTSGSRIWKDSEYVQELDKILERTLDQRRHYERMLINFNDSYTPMFEVSLENYFTRANQAGLDFFQMSREDLLSKTWIELTHPDDVHEDRENVERVIAGSQKHYAMNKRYRVSGGYVWARLEVYGIEESEKLLAYSVRIYPLEQIEQWVKSYE